MILSKDKPKETAEHFNRQYSEIAREVSMTVQDEEERHFRGGNALALSMLAVGFSPAAIHERTKFGIFSNSKLSKAEARKILKRAIDQAAAEWDAAGE
ncbi:hypothetical protein [Variovorax sp. Sphag1AA]|uniref:hypothetical protein n=1 Tax=Variovorax sp. Sphag1AA TaxID=2587027 RepID=UPI0016094A0F|nr:hypothetical protein [Variovorax sp. Sphag1AA]MBB3176254.1 CubicO group peptidase (beta-lactamase class C family) [Variovorax sp. Sphag1AA]